MIVTCDDCELDFDDVYRRTYCPHEWFEMRTTVVGVDVASGDGKVLGVATTLEELDRLMKK